MTQFYKVWHTGCDDGCNGNPQVLTTNQLKAVEVIFGDWTVDEKGNVTASDNPNWTSQNKTFHAAPIVESEKALSLEQRINFDAECLAPMYKVSIEANWDNIPEWVKNDPISMGAYELLKNGDLVWHRKTVADFVGASDITNVVLADDKSVSGYDHSTETQFHFIPVVD